MGSPRRVRCVVRTPYQNDKKATIFNVTVRIPEERYCVVSETELLTQNLETTGKGLWTVSTFGPREKMQTLAFEVCKTDFKIFVEVLKERYPAAIVEYKLDN